MRSRNSRVATGVTCLVAAVILFSGAVSAEDATAKIDNFTFVPARLTVKAGTTVTWRNEDDIPHPPTRARIIERGIELALRELEAKKAKTTR